MSKQANYEHPHEKMQRATALLNESRALEKEAIREAIIAGEGYLKRAAEIVGMGHRALAALIVPPGRRHHDLKPLLHGIAGRPPTKPESIAERAKRMPKAFISAQGGVTAPTKRPSPTRKPERLQSKAAKPAKKEEFTVIKKTDEEWSEIVDRWIEARKAGANQKAFAAEHGVGVSTLRERTAKRLAAMDVSMEVAAHTVTGGEV